MTYVELTIEYLDASNKKRSVQASMPLHRWRDESYNHAGWARGYIRVLTRNRGHLVGYVPTQYNVPTVGTIQPDEEFSDADNTD